MNADLDINREGGTDIVLPWAVEPLAIRGRSVALSTQLDAILQGHEYPASINYLLAQATVIVALLGSTLKFDGKLILQAQGDGAVSLLVADYTTEGGLRAYAKFDDQAIGKNDENPPFNHQNLLGKGALALTIDQGPNTERYQGIVELKEGDLEAAAHRYFRQSEQIPTIIKTSAAQIVQLDSDGQKKQGWCAGGILAQFLPEEGGINTTQMVTDNESHLADEQGQAEPVLTDDRWTETESLVHTISDDEITDPRIGAERLLYRLFHEHGVRVWQTSGLKHHCPCSEERLLHALSGLSHEELQHAIDDKDSPGKIVSVCQFCGKKYEFSGADVLSAKG